MKKLLEDGALIACLILVVICFVAEAIIQFVPIPEGHSRVGADWYLFIHYWYIHLTFALSVVGAGLLLNKK